MRRGDRASREKCPHYVHGIHTQSCAEHMRHRLRRTRHLEMGAGWDTEAQGEASTSTGNSERRFNQLLKEEEEEGGGEMGFRELGSRWTGSDNIQEQI